MAFKAVRSALRSDDDAEKTAKLVFEKVFNRDVRNLLSMEDMWRFRDKPVPLDFEAIKENRFELHGKNADQVPTNGAVATNGNGVASNGTPSSSKLRDQRTLSLRDSWEMFVASTDKLGSRLRAGEETISFDKDDDDTLDFVTAAANLRSAAYGIPSKSRWEVKEMAGNIIPAIATTNAIVSGLIVLQALHVLRNSLSSLRNVHIQFKPSVPLSSIGLSSPSPACGVCRDAYALLRCDPSRATLGSVIDAVVAGASWGNVTADGDVEMEPPAVSAFEGSRLLSDPDFDDNLGRTLKSLGVGRGKFLSIQDEDSIFQPISLAIVPLPSDHPADGPSVVLPSPMPAPAKRPAKPMPKTPEPASPRTSLKRPAPHDDDFEASQPAKKLARTPTHGSPSKRRQLEDDGLVILEKQGEAVEDDDDDDVIIIE